MIDDEDEEGIGVAERRERQRVEGWCVSREFEACFNSFVRCHSPVAQKRWAGETGLRSQASCPLGDDQERLVAEMLRKKKKETMSRGRSCRRR